MHTTALGAREGTRKLEDVSRGRIKWDKLPTLATDGHKFATQTMGMTRRERSHIEKRQCGTADDVSGSVWTSKRHSMRHVAQITENHGTHGWLIAALLPEMWGLKFELRGEHLRFQSVSPPGKCLSSSLVAEDGHSDSGQC